MFYSHQLLARKAPLGQIWMAATMHAKINRRKLDKLDIIKICEEILNPSVPMALRLSGILMGGVVIVYERKVKLLYDDVTRFLVEINEAWKVKSVADPTVLPKGKSQAKYEAVTLPDNVDMEVERTLHFSDASFTAAAARFQRMRLDDLDEHYINININPRDEDLSQHHHQAEAANITLFEDFGSCLAETDLYDRFERFDIGEDEETQINFTPQEHPQVPPTLRPSPPPQDAHPQAPTSRMSSPPTQHEPPQDGYQVEEQEDRQTEAHKETAQEAEGHARRQGPSKRKARTQVIMDNEQIMIPGNIYQMWLQDASDIVSKRGRKNKPHNPILTTKIAILMELPPVALISGLERFPGELHYPAPLLELWRKCTQATPAHGSSSGGKSTEAQHNPASHSPPEGLSHRNIIPEFPVGDFQSEIGSHPMGISIEKGRPEHENIGLQASNEAVFSDHFDTPRSPGQSSKSIPSSGSGRTFLPLEPEMPPPSARYKRRHLGKLDPVEEDRPLQQNLRGFKIPRLYEDRPTPDTDLLEETGTTQTPHPVIFDPSVDKITQSIRTHLKLHFDTPGAPQSESLDQLASGMSRKKAAQLFYQTCVLATCDFVKVHQAEAFGDIIISRGPKM